MNAEIHRFRFTNSWCITEICPAGPPKLMNPSFSQKRTASEKDTDCVEFIVSFALISHAATGDRRSM